MKIRSFGAFAAILILALTLAAIPSRAQAPKELWVRRYDGLNHRDDKALKVSVDISGNVIVTGSENDNSLRYTAKYAVGDGALLWEQRHLNGVLEDAIELAVDCAGNVILTGLSESDRDKVYTAKYAGADGTLLWKKAFKRPNSFADEPLRVVDRLYERQGPVP